MHGEKMKIQYCGFTDQGYKRKKNQDYIVMRANEQSGLFVVADGMGGHVMGEKASSTIGEFMEGWWNYFQNDIREKHFPQLIQEICNCLEQANQCICNKYNMDGVCGSTVVVLFIHHGKYAYFTCGDSRLYLYAKRNLQQISVDDVWENQPEIMYQYTQEQKENHPDYGKLVTAVGTSPVLQLRVMQGDLTGKEKFLLCSDGLYRMCSGQEMSKALHFYKDEKSGVHSLKRMQTVVYENGAKDNCSVILVKVKK